MDSLATALWTVSLALIGKTVFDLWDRYRNRQSVASAIAGELRGHLDLLSRPEDWASYRRISSVDRTDRIRWLKAVQTFPFSNPVFDHLADRIGCLPHNAAGEVSRTYSTITGLRLLMSTMPSVGFIDADDDVQTARLTLIADVMQIEIPRSLSLVPLLCRISEQSFLDWMIDSDLSRADNLN